MTRSPDEGQQEEESEGRGPFRGLLFGSLLYVILGLAYAAYWFIKC